MHYIKFAIFVYALVILLSDVVIFLPVRDKLNKFCF